ncbi:MAG: hypothetical protein HHJ13_00290 [Phycicoccus sp.]|nr:hypothetical protein [Phycicoccus sp.]
MIPTTNRRRLAEDIPELTVAQAFDDDDDGLAQDELRVALRAGSRSDTIDAALRLRCLVSTRAGCEVPSMTLTPPGRRPVARCTFTPAPRALGALALAGYDVAWDEALYPPFSGSIVDAGTLRPAAFAELELAS